MKKVVFASMIAAVSAACSTGVEYILANYSQVKPEIVATDDDDYRVFEHQTENKLMITSSVGRAAATGYARGLTLGIAGGVAPKPLFEAAAVKFLNNTGRKHCSVTDGYMLVEPQMEFKFACAPSVAKKEPRTEYQAAASDMALRAARDKPDDKTEQRGR